MQKSFYAWVRTAFFLVYVTWEDVGMYLCFEIFGKGNICPFRKKGHFEPFWTSFWTLLLSKDGYVKNYILSGTMLIRKNGSKFHGMVMVKNVRFHGLTHSQKKIIKLQLSVFLKQIIVKDYTCLLKYKNEYKLTCFPTCVSLILHITGMARNLLTQLHLTAYSTNDSQLVYICLLQKDYADLS